VYTSTGREVGISADWQPLLNRIQQLHQWHINLWEAVARKAEPDLRVPRRPATVTLGVAVSGPDERPEHIARHHVESFIYDVFLIMNISSPGCCNFYNAKMRSRSDSRRSRYADRRFRLSEYSFDLAALDGYAGKWPRPRTLQVSPVVDWYRRIRVGASQVPNSRMEKVLFALMHLAREDVSVNTVVWLFYALETFFDTRPGENFRTLVKRIELWLTPDDHQKGLLKRNLRALYDLRSSFVHGGRDVIHPLHNEAADGRVEKHYRELMETTEFGFAVLLASVQEATSRSWTELTFAETVSGGS
jgi:hypothetical protein